jgi:hypothetical protein
VSCATVTACTAVGWYGSPAVLVAETWNGATWTITPTPPLPRNHGVGPAAVFNGVSCVSSTACVAVGVYSAQVAVRSLAEVWNSTTWTVQPIPNPFPTSLQDTNGLEGVSCTSSTSCTAVGYAQAGANALAEGWNGSSWQVEWDRWGQAFTGVSCIATACTGVTIDPFVEREVGLSS